jgi:hypothetical protein
MIQIGPHACAWHMSYYCHDTTSRARLRIFRACLLFFNYLSRKDQKRVYSLWMFEKACVDVIKKTVG